MGKPTGFMEFTREGFTSRPVTERVQDYNEVYAPSPTERVQRQAARCMDCGVPFCQSGCPLGNVIPDWNDLVYNDQWKAAYRRLRSTNNFPEFTGRLCPAPCESACVLGIIEPPVSIEQIELAIVERAFTEGWVKPKPPKKRSGKTVAVIGSGPAGLAAADQLNQAGHTVTVFERHDRIGGLLRYGIPDFKLDKSNIDRRLAVMEAEGITFKTNMHIGKDVPVDTLSDFDAIVLCGGATKPRDIPIPGRDLEGIYFAWDFLSQQNQRVAGDALAQKTLPVPEIHAKGKHVIVIGGGDTGSDCVGTSNRHGAKSITQFELLPMPTSERPERQPWPYYPMILRTSSSHEEGADRFWSILTKSFTGNDGKVTSLETVEVEMVRGDDGRMKFEEVADSQKTWPADLVLVAVGYTGPEPDGVLGQLGVTLDARGNAQTDSKYQTNLPHVFAAGDMRRGQSLIVWAISEGREAARAVDEYLVGATVLPSKGIGDLPVIR